MEKLKEAFYRRKDPVRIARELLGKLLVSRFHGRQTIGRIVEVEAYNGVVDKAAHSYGGRRTKRTDNHLHGANPNRRFDPCPSCPGRW